MTKLLWIFSLGLCCWVTYCQAKIVISCRFSGVFHVEKDYRYSLLYEEARRTCTDIDAVIATREQVEIAFSGGFETCRYGWVDNSTALIPRVKSNPKCAANYIGIYILQSNLTSQYDVYCYNASETSEKNCEQYDYRNKSVPSYDPTEEEEGHLNVSESSKVSTTHPGLDLSSAQPTQGFHLEEVDTTEPMSTSTDQPEHSGDAHVGPMEDGEINDPIASTEGDVMYSGPDHQDDLIEVYPTNYEDDDFTTVTEPTIHRDPGSKHDNTHEHDHEHEDGHDHGHNDHKETERGEDNTDTKTVDGSAEESSGSNTTRGRRRAAIPEWLIVCVSLVCLGLIFSVCIALNAGRICGHKKKLIINGNKASALEEGVIMEHNGDTVKSQEMVQLVSQDQSNNGGEALTQDDIRNAQDVDMKIGM